jgi:hypothetical protein
MYRFALLVIVVTLLTSSIAQATSYLRTDGAIVDPIMNWHSASPRSYSGNNLKGGADLISANLSSADLTYATFSPGTNLKDEQTVLQHGFDAAGLQTYLEASPVYAWSANNLTFVPEPASVFLTGLLTLARGAFLICRRDDSKLAFKLA